MSSSSATNTNEQQNKKSRRRRRGRGRDKKRRAGARRKQLKSERLAKNSLRVLYWNCGSMNVRKSTAETLAYQADVVCFQETQRGRIKPADFCEPIYNDEGHGQLILVRKGIKHRRLEVSTWASDNLHLVGVELIDQPIRNIINVYACNASMREGDWMVLDQLQTTLAGETLLCGDFNARGAMWGNTVVNPQGEALEDALDHCYLTCINDGSVTRTATRPGDSNSVIDLALTTLQVAQQCKWQSLGSQDNDHIPCTIFVRRSRTNKSAKRKRAFTYKCANDNPVDKLRQQRQVKPETLNKERRDQPPWFTLEVERLWEAKRKACRRSQRNKGDANLKEEAKQAAKVFEEAANKEKEQRYEDFSQTVSQDRTLYKFWRLYGAMNGSKTSNEVPDFRREDDVWMRTPEEKGTAFLTRYLAQTDQQNEEERRILMCRLENHLEDQDSFWLPHTPISPDAVKTLITSAEDTSPGPDGVKYSHLGSLGDQDRQDLTKMLNDSLENHEIPEDWLDSHLSPVPKPDKDHTSIKGYRIVTMQNTVGKLLEKFVARRLAIELEDRDLLPATLGSYRRGKDTWANAAVLASDVYDAFEKKQETLVVALDLEDAYNRVDFKILIRTLKNMAIDPYLMMWIGRALLRRKVAMRVGPWTSDVKTITPGLPQGSALSPVLFNVYTVGITSNQLEAPGRTLSFADDVLVYRHGDNREEIARSAQQELNRIGDWCEENNGKIHPDKASVLWCSLNNHAVKAEMPEVHITGKPLKREQSLRYLGVIFDRSLSGKDQITRIVQRARRGLTAVKTMAGARMPQKTLVILYQALVVSVIEYGLGLLTLSASQLKRLDVIQNEGMRAILGCTKDTSAEAMRHLLDMPTATERHRLAQVKAYLRVAADEKHPLHDKVGRQTTSRLKRGTEWMAEASATISDCLPNNNIRKGATWVEVNDNTGQYTHVIATLGRECREWAPGATNAEVETLIEENSSPRDPVIFTDGSVKRGVKSGWAFTVRVSGKVEAESSGAVGLTTSSMSMEVTAITESLKYLKGTQHTKAIVVTDSMSTLEKVKRGYLHVDWISLIKDSQLQFITWVFSPGHAGVRGNERADQLAGEAEVNQELTLDPPMVLAHVKEHLVSKRPETTSYTKELLLDKRVEAGEGRRCLLRGAARRQYNQLLMETVSLHTLRSTLKMRGEQIWTCPTCLDPDAEDK